MWTRRGQRISFAGAWHYVSSAFEDVHHRLTRDRWMAELAAMWWFVVVLKPIGAN
jgi:hypothetical protein